MDLPDSLLFYEIFGYLNTSEVFTNLSLVCKDWDSILSSSTFRKFWMNLRLGLNIHVNLPDISIIYPSLKATSIINYEPWKTNGGTSLIEMRNSYYDMWQYNSDCYSTYYSENSTESLVKNICCLAYFTGQFQKKRFIEGFYADIYGLRYNPESICEKYSFDENDQCKTLVLDPLNETNKLSNYKDFDLWLERGMTMFHQRRKVKSIDPIFSETLIPIVNKIAVARPLYFTGVVKTLIYIFANEEIGDFEIFNEFNDIENYYDAVGLGDIVNHVNNEEFEYVEFLERKGRSVYPALWLQFKTWKANHIVVELKKCHSPKIACVKFINIDDRRADFNLQSMQPNFDIMYSLLLGTIININE